MQIGIVTFQWYDNYGTVLQAYALQESLRKLGYDARIVPIEFDASPGIKRYLAKTLKGTLKKLDKYMVERGNKRRNQFSAFRRRFFHYADMPHGTFSQMLKMRIPCDVLIWGSDNIWSPWCVPHDDDMAKLFLGDGVDHPVKMSYGASTGGRLVRHPRHLETLARIASAGFKAIAVRESVNLPLFEAHHLQAVQVPDPTLLLTSDDWQKIFSSKSASNERYVMGYDLGHKGAFSVRAVCDKLARSMGCSVAIPYPKRRFRDLKISCYPGPQEWLSLIKNVECLVTNSFHGVMFALIFNRPFLFLEIAGNEEAQELNMRAKEILKCVGLESRMVSAREMDADSIIELARTPIDWAAVNKRLNDLRRKGENYLILSLGLGDGKRN